MRKVFILLFISLALLSCQKEYYYDYDYKKNINR